MSKYCRIIGHSFGIDPEEATQYALNLMIGKAASTNVKDPNLYDIEALSIVPMHESFYAVIIGKFPVNVKKEF